jgi:hypothetical protein
MYIRSVSTAYDASAGANGLDGANGADGGAGPQGAVGLQGAVGPQGAVGSKGATGFQGAVGAAGAPGPQGATGTVGANGADGGAGPQGAVGLQGATGFQGAVGAVGATGFQGAVGAVGAAGPQGDPGPQGVVGPQGAVGAVGDAGAPGPQGATGTAGPALVKVRVPAVPLTSAEGSRATASSTLSNGNEAFVAFNDLYGAGNTGGPPNFKAVGWYSENKDNSSSLSVDGDAITGRYIYVDTREGENDDLKPIVTSFQLYAMPERFPIEFHLVGSNDKNDEKSWTSLYHTTSSTLQFYSPSIPGIGYGPETALTSNYRYYRYVGVLVVSQDEFGRLNNTSVAELLMWSTR